MTNVIGLLEYYEDLLMMIMMIFLKLIPYFRFDHMVIVILRKQNWILKFRLKSQSASV